MLLSGFLKYLSYTVKAHLYREGAIHSGLGPRTSVSNQKNSPQTCSQVNLMKAIPQLRFLLHRHV